MHPAGFKERVEPRIRTTVRARMRDSRQERDICIIDMSTRGMLATTAQPPKRGEIVVLIVGCNQLTGQVKWSSERGFGISLRERVSVAARDEGGAKSAQIARSVGVAHRSTSGLGWLSANPQMLGRMREYVALLAMAAGAAYVIASLTGTGLAPLVDATAVMNR